MSIDEQPGTADVVEIGFMTELSTVATHRTVQVPVLDDDPAASVGEHIDLAIAEAGAGGRPLLLVHGFTGAKEDFRDVIGPLAAAGHWVVAPDLRGHGASAHPAGEGAYGLDRFTADVSGLLDALGWDRFDLLGHSMGGMIAQLVAVSRAERIDRLVLMDTATGGAGAGSGGDESGGDSIDGMDADIMRLGIELCRAEGMAAIAAVLDMGEKPLETPAHARMASLPGWKEWESEKFLTSSPDMWCAMVEQFLTVEDRMATLRDLPMPTLVIVGEQDRPFLAVSRRMSEVIPDARLVVVADAGHSPQFENPQAWYAAVAGFLAR